MKRIVVAVLALSLSGCTNNYAFLQALGIGDAKVLAAAQKLDAANTVLAEDLPQLCQIAGKAVLVGSAFLSTVTGPLAVQVAKAVVDVTAAANSDICSKGLTGTTADATTIANSINEVKAATGKSVTTISTSN